MTYECEICNKIIKSYNGFYRHKKRNNCNNKNFTCLHCNNKFKHKSSLSYHVNKTCRVIKERKIELEELEKIKEQLNNMQKQMVEKDINKSCKIKKEIQKEQEQDEIKQIKEQLKVLTKRMEEKDKAMELLKQPQNINIEGNMNNIHLHINPHGQEKLDNINPLEIVKMLISYINPNMVKKINIDVDENKNTYITNVRSNYGLILDNGDWNHIEMDRLLNDLMIDNMDRATDYISNNKELFTQYITISKYHELKYSLDLYFNKSIDKAECMKKIKDVLIANRNLVSSFYEGITGQKIKLSK